MNFILFVTLLIISFNGFSSSLQAAGKNSTLQKALPDSPHQVESESTHQEFNLICPICTENQVDTLFQPCHHITACQFCALRVTECPQCRTPIQKRVNSISLRFSTGVGASQNLEKPPTEEFEALCTLCKAQPIDTLHIPCRHLSSCHECASHTSTCPQCSAEINERIHPVFMSFLPEIKELQEDQLSSEIHSQLRSDPELRSQLQKFLQDVRGSADLLAELENLSLKSNTLRRSGREVVVRAQASAIFSVGIEISLGCYTTSHFCGVPYLRLGFVSGLGNIGAIASLSSRTYSMHAERPSPDFTSIINDDDLLTGALGLGSTLHDFNHATEIRERGIAAGCLILSANQGKTIVRIPLFLPTQRFSKKGRLLLKAKKLELKMIRLIRKQQWAEVYQNILPDYHDTVADLLDRVSRKHRIYRSREALAVEHPFYSLENLYHAAVIRSTIEKPLQP